MLNLPPERDALGGYGPRGDIADLFGGAACPIAAKWVTMANGLVELGDGSPSAVQEQISRQAQDLGLTFRQTGETEEQVWPLNPMPLIIGTDEWTVIERGLCQRAELLEQIIADIYGPQTLVTAGHLPASVVTGARNFHRKMLDVQPAGGHYLHLYAVDLARGPNGEWRVLADRVQYATGIGYALENRLAVSRGTGSLLSQINTRRVAGFFAQLRAGIAAKSHRDNPRIALLTPGRFNQSYPEQAHLARYLGFPLVEGRDLTVSDNRLYVRTIAGPKRIDALWRWIDTRYLDPLAFDANSTIGVADLFDAWANGGLTVTNWPGSGVIEARAFSAFIPRLAKVLIGEPLRLPNVATWWCGQRAEADIVRDRFDDLVISSAFGAPVDGLAGGITRRASSFTDAERRQMLAAITRRPMDYCGQEIVRLSTTPSLVDDTFAPRQFTMRAFAARDADGNWIVMPGGFARLSGSGALRTPLMEAQDQAADVCIVDEHPVAQTSLLGTGTVPEIRRGGGILSSQAADNLYWFSRYSERAEMTVRVIRSLLGSSIEADGGSAREPAALARLIHLLVQWGAIDGGEARLPVQQLCAKAFAESERPGGVATLVDHSRNIGRSLRDRMANDFWRIANAPVPQFDPAKSKSMLRSINLMIERFSALSGLAAENMVRGHAWRFFDMGRRIERALNNCRIGRVLTGGERNTDELGILLDLCESQIVYRARYLTGPRRAPVLDLVLLEPQNPRSLMFQLMRIEEHIAVLPTLVEDGIPERPLREACAITAQLQSLTADRLDGDSLSELETRLLALSEAISTRYFLQYQKEVRTVQESFLA